MNISIFSIWDGKKDVKTKEEAWEDRLIKLNPIKENFFSKNFFSGQKIDQFYYFRYRRGLSGKKKPIEKHIFLDWMYSQTRL